MEHRALPPTTRMIDRGQHLHSPKPHISQSNTEWLESHLSGVGWDAEASAAAELWRSGVRKRCEVKVGDSMVSESCSLSDYFRYYSQLVLDIVL